jgi:regulator of sirC expression with transglutaminase-like and TPR domain
MLLQFSVPSPLDYFAALVQSDAHFPLLEAAIALAQDDYPETDIQQVLGDVDQLLARLKRRIPTDASALQRLGLLNHFFFRELHFGGNFNDYYEPDNSYLNAVLRTRRGIPISLAVLWIELAQSIGLQAHGVGFPGHFMVKIGLPRGQVVIDPLTGHSLGREELVERLEPYRDSMTVGGEWDIPLALYLQSEAPRYIIARMLRNLKEIHRSHEDWLRFVAVQHRLIVLLPDAWNEYRDRGLALAELGQVELALNDLETYLAKATGAADLNAVADRVGVLLRG